MLENSLESHATIPPALAEEMPVNSDTVLTIQGVSKRFCRDLKRSLWYGLQDIGRELVGLPSRGGDLKQNEFWALQNVSFELKKGSVIGLVGTNGCGKTTLMRVISGLIKPTYGKVVAYGRLAPLLALGAGFNTILTGRENIYTNMSVLGLTKDEIDAVFDEVVEFSEIGYALDAPVQSYSSGMVARLGFACAICTQPDIMLIDEVLAVGDLKFREKCISALEKLRDGGTSMIMVHHSPDLLLTICDRAVYLVKGEVEDAGEATRVIDRYERDLNLTIRQPKNRASENASALDDESMHTHGGLLDIEAIRLVNESGEETDVVSCGEACAVEVPCVIHDPGQQFNARVTVYRLPRAESVTQQEVLVLTLNSGKDGLVFGPLPAGRATLRLELPLVALVPARYKVTVHIYSNKNLVASGYGPKFDVIYEREGVGGPFYQPRQWQVQLEGAAANREL